MHNSLHTPSFTPLHTPSYTPAHTHFLVRYYRAAALSATTIVETTFHGDYGSLRPLEMNHDSLGDNVVEKAARDIETLSYWNFNSDRKGIQHIDNEQMDCCEYYSILINSAVTYPNPSSPPSFLPSHHPTPRSQGLLRVGTNIPDGVFGCPARHEARRRSL